MNQTLAIQTDELGRRYGKRWVVQELALQVPRGAVYGLLGLNAAGKSTTIRMLMGLIRRHAGTASVLGLDPARDDVALKRRVGYVPEVPGFYEWMTVEQVCGFVAHYRKNEWNCKQAETYIERFRLPRDTRLKELSKGQRAKVSLLLALSFDPELLILDEPTTGLDPVARREFIEGVLSEYQESGKTIFISSHLVNEIAGLVDHVGILYEGKLLWQSRAEEFLAALRRVRLVFRESVPPNLNCPGLLGCKSNGREAVLSVEDFDEERTLAALRELGAEEIEVEAMNLEDAFVEFIRGAEKGVR